MTIQLAVRAFAVATIALFGITLVIENVPAGPDVMTPAAVSTWVDLARINARTNLGPFNLSVPRLADARCAPDGRRALLTFEAPITSRRTMVLLQFLATDPVSADQQIVASVGDADDFDSGSCSKVPTGPVFLGGEH